MCIMYSLIDDIKRKREAEDDFKTDRAAFRKASAVKTDETEKISTAGRTFTLVKQKMPAIAAKIVSSESARLRVTALSLRSLVT